MSQPSICVSLHMHSENEGGRHGPFNEGYMPHFVVEGDDEWLGVKSVQCPGWVGPGETSGIVFALMYFPEVDYSALQTGRKFAVHEGAKIVGHGVVLSRGNAASEL